MNRDAKRIGIIGVGILVLLACVSCSTAVSAEDAPAPSVSLPLMGPGPELLPGAISVSSSPSDARVTIDGCNWIDTTPCKTPDLPLGNYTVRVSREGYQEWTKTVEVTFNETTYVHATLTPNPTPEAPLTVFCAVIALIISGIIATKTKVRKN